MTADQILKELEELADRSGITIRYEKGDFDGGYCVLKAERLIVVNRKLPPTKKASVVAQAMAEVGVEEMYLKPVVREFIEEELSKAAQEALRTAGVAAAQHLKVAAASGPTSADAAAIIETSATISTLDELIVDETDDHRPDPSELDPPPANPGDSEPPAPEQEPSKDI